ncbi:PhzF family phenazine biosynthesis protein [Salinisphaera aquimarina]|uniref:PhzF family phenazine biosynthesis protein n=1 Tax=Salinisphaera aquimarina TaxID=2094031 RepID=A0ABV7ENX3_9GAMM
MTKTLRHFDYYQIDAFTSRVFSGNPAAVVILDAWLDDSTLAAIAAEHNLSETAFIVPGEQVHALRWFTPACEVELCGHATLASAYTLLYCRDGFSAPLRFSTRHAGELGVDVADDMLWLDFPARPATPYTGDTDELETALGARPRQWLASSNLLAVFDNASQVAALAPDLRALARYSARTDLGFIVTAPADHDEYDFVSRYFAPHHGVDEDPVTGSAHCTLAPYWGERLGKTELLGRQISRRGGRVACRLAGERVHLGGHAARYAEGRLFLDPLEPDCS